MAVFGLQINGRLGSSNGGSPPSTTDFTPFAVECGQPGGPVAGTNTFTLPNYASGLVSMVVNDNTYTVNKGFTVSGAGVVVLLAGNFVLEDTITGCYVGT